MEGIDLIVCGGAGDACQLCDIFVLFQRLFNFLLVPILPVLATALALYGGFLLLTAGGNPSQVTQAKGVLFAVVVGIVIVLGAWVLINTLMTVLGVAEWVGFGGEWWQVQVKCD
ncbi:hypothetical protein KKI17_01830 [Patescibacteria group bacterium]|nr:hypothetical protein [Patescibacteria group bacterium]